MLDSAHSLDVNGYCTGKSTSLSKAVNGPDNLNNLEKKHRHTFHCMIAIFVCTAVIAYSLRQAIIHCIVCVYVTSVDRLVIRG